MTLDPYHLDFAARDWETDVDGTVRVAVIGLGGFAREYAIPAIETGDYCELAAVVSGTPAKADRVADDRDARALSYDAFHDGEAADSYDAVYVCTPNALHLPHVETAAELGKDVICEKPLEATVERAERIVDACEASDVTLMTAYRMQTEPLVRRLRESIADGLVGEVVQTTGSFCFRAVEGDPDQWRFDPDLAGGGALYDIGVYPLNTTRFLLGMDPEAVSASVTRDDAVLDGMDRDASFRLDFPGGVSASCRTSYGTHAENQVTILGTDGRIRLDPAFAPRGGRHLTVERDDGTLEVAVEQDEMVEQFDYFGHALLAGRDVEPDGEDGLFDMRALAAIYESDRSGGLVSI